MNIALAVVVDPYRTRTLIAQRPPGVHLEHAWEFPGGKIEEHETAAECAVREAREETDHDVTIVEAWEPITYEYPERVVTLHPFLCEADPIEARYGRCLWIPIEDLSDYPFPEANAPLLERLRQLARREKPRNL